MSGSIIPTPAYKAVDWQSFGAQVEKQRLGFISLSLTNYDNDTVPQIAAGSVVEISGSLFQFPSNDSIGGTPTSDQINYIMLEVSGGGDSQTISGSWTTTAPTWNNSKQGWYDATGNKRYVAGCYYNGANYTSKWVYGILHQSRLDDVGDGYVYKKIRSVDGNNRCQTDSIADGQVNQVKLKTASASVSISVQATQTRVTSALPGGEYAFLPQCKGDGTYLRTQEQCLSFGSNGILTAWSTSYTTPGMGVYNTHTTTAKTFYAQTRYVTASGEVYWIFILRNKNTKEIEAMYQAPDHPCFGYGGDPIEHPHPFGNYNKDEFEIIVINPDITTVKAIKTKTSHKKDFLEVLVEDYGIDEESNPSWSDVSVTVDIKGDDFFLGHQEEIEVVKKVIPKPDYIKCRKLKERIIIADE